MSLKVPHPVRPAASALALAFCLSTFAPAASAGQTISTSGVVNEDMYGNNGGHGTMEASGHPGVFVSDPTSVTGDASGNTLNIRHDVTGNTMGVAGGMIEKSTGIGNNAANIATGNVADNNTVNVTGGSGHIALSCGVTCVWERGVAGGAVVILNGTDPNSPYDSDASVTGNKVNIDGAVIRQLDVRGGLAYTDSRKATAKNNHVILADNAKLDEEVAGGIAQGNTGAESSENTVTMKDNSSTSGGIYGGFASALSGSSLAEKNKVLIKGGISSIPVVEIGMSGGLARNDSGISIAHGNEVEIEDGKVFGSIRGGMAFNNTGHAVADTNKVTILSGAISENPNSFVLNDDVTGSFAYGALSAKALSGTVEIKGGTVLVNIIGGHADGNYDNVSVLAWNNSVTVTAGTVATGADHFVTGGYVSMADSSDASDLQALANTVTIQGGTVGNVYGGLAENYTATATANATKNIVNISGVSSIGGDVIGGKIDCTRNITPCVTGATAMDNTVTLRDVQTIGGDLLGGQILKHTGGNAFSGNKLELYSTGLTVENLGNFEFMNFYLPGTVAAGDIILRVTGNASLTDGASQFTKIGIDIDGATSTLTKGDKVILIDAGNLTGTPIQVPNASGTQGSTIRYTFTLVADGQQLAAFVESASASEESKSLSEGYLAATAFLTQASDFLTSRGLQAAQNALAANPSGMESFAAIGGGKLRHETGSHVDVDGYTLVAGVASGFNTGMGKATLSAFFEYGDGDYTSYNSFASGKVKVKGKGDTGYKGVGVLGRVDLGNATYLEGSLRGGKTDVDYRTDDTGLGRYDARGNYAGAHLGAGEVWKLGEGNTLDAYLQFLWTHQDRESVTLKTNKTRKDGETLKFDAVDSRRIKIGVRAKHAFSANFSGYAGLSYDHETSARARATTNGYKIETPDLKGGTGTVEFGLTGKPMSSQPLYLDLGVQGHGGKRDGVTASFRASYLF